LSRRANDARGCTWYTVRYTSWNGPRLAHRGAAEAVLLHLVDERHAARAQSPRRFGLIAEGLAQCPRDQVPLERLGLLAQREAVGVRRRVLGRRRRERRGLERPTRRERGEARDGVLELPHVAGPVGGGEARDELGREAQVVETEFLGAAARQLLGERG